MKSPDEILELEDAWRVCRRRIDALLANPDLANGTALTGFKIAYSHAKPRDPASFHAIYQEAMLRMAQRYQELQAQGQALSQMHLLRDHSDPLTSAAYPQYVAPFAAGLRDLLADLETHAARLRPDVPKRHQAEMDEPFLRFSSVAHVLITALDESSAGAKRLHHAQSGTKPHSIKPGYKQTEVGVIPEDWEVKTLSQITETHRPISYGIVQTGPSIANGVPCLRVVDINDGRINKDDLITTTRKISDAYRRTVLKDGDLVMPLRGKVGDVGQIDKDLEGANLTRGVALIAVRSEWSPVFCQQIISAPSTRKRLEQAMNGSALQEIPIASLRAFQIPIPQSLPEQHTIAAALSDVDALLSALDRLLAKKRDLKQAAMQQLLTGQTRLPGFTGEWVVKRLGEIAQPRKERDDPRRSGGHEFCVELENLASATGSLFGSTTAGQSASLKSVFKEGDVLFGKLRAYLRKYWYATRPGVCSTEIWALIASPELSGRFLFQLVQTNEFIDAASNAYGTHMPRSDWKVVRELEVSLPPLHEQTVIASVLSDMDAELAALEQRREKTRALKQGMMQELLTGRTRLL